MLFEHALGSALLVVDTELRVHLVEGSAYGEIGWHQDMLGGLLPELLPASAWTVLEPHYQLALAGGTAVYDFTTPSGTVHWTRTIPMRDEDDVVIGAITASTDVTAHERRAGENRRRALLEGSPLPTAAVDRSGAILRANQALCDLIGYSEDLLLGRNAHDLVHPNDRGGHRDAFDATVRGDSQAARGNGRYVCHDGSIVDVQYNLTIVRDELRRPVEYLIQLVDETRQRSTTDALQQRLGEQAVITLLGERALAGLPLEDLVAEAVSAAVQVLEADMGGYGELSPDGESLTVLRSVGFGPDVGGRTFLLPPAIREAVGSLVNLDDVLDLSEGSVLGAQGTSDSVAVVVGDPSDPLGILGVFVRDGRQFGDAERNFVRAVAHVLASATGRARAEERSRHEALHDGLTGLPNRALLVDRSDQSLAAVAGTSGQVTVVLIDIDSFKLVNDALGHSAGDDVLRELGPRLVDELGPTDTVARFAADEFAVLCVDPTGERHADRIAEQVQRAFVRPFLLQGETHFLSASLGVTVAPAGSARAGEELLRDADAALNRAKQRGRGGYELFDPRTRAEVVSRLQTETDLRRAIEEGQLRLEYQPYFDLETGAPGGVEALVRWQHPDRGLVMPGEFIPVAEETGLIARVGEWVLRCATQDMARWRDEHEWATGLRVTVNVSARQVSDRRELLAAVESALCDAALPPELLGIEITEGLLLDESRGPLEALSSLKRVGVRLLLDDFGTGYSSLSYLSRFPVDVLKVDRSFVRDLGTRSDTTPIVTAIVALARGLGLDVIAEGVETAEQAAALRELGCNYAQGFLLARPMPAEQLIARLS